MAGESFIDRINPTYCSCLITYVDVLGFAELIEKSRKDPTLVPKIASLLSAIKVAASSGGQIHRDADGKAIDIFSAFNFSDLTIRTTQIPTGNQVSNIFQWEIFYLAELQLNLLIDGYPIRGSMCVGDLYARESEGIVFGPSLVKAYVLESSYAIFPRIVIDRDLAATIKREGDVAG
jgi:hypothetical protein